MTRSSPISRRSQAFTSPERGFLSSFLGEDRNTEYSHKDALEAAQAEHERVREAAVRVFQLHELQEEHNRILEAERIEQERLKAEAQIAEEERRLRELKAKSIPKPPPEPEPPKQPDPPKEEESAKPQESATKSAETNKANKPQAPTLDLKPVTQQPASTSPFASVPSKQPQQSKSSFGQPDGPETTQTTPAAAPTPAAPKPQPAAQPPAAVDKTAGRYNQIHQELKKLRKKLVAESKVQGSPLKPKLGTFRREIRNSIGQLTSGRGANSQAITKITEMLREALHGKAPSPAVDVSAFVADSRQPAADATNNDATLPALFIYLLNICAKGIISQFINEGGANTKAADPVGVFAAHIFSTKEFQWRGKPLIDILIAKFRVVCPVLFGVRGNDKTESGRAALGWKKDGPSWITEQAHNDRMTGLGAGFASLSLRDFSKTTKSNPYPPTNYWKALAGIVNTPANEVSNTQYIVLRSMIRGHEQRFINFYGNAALAALRLALVEFPEKAPSTFIAAGSLRALAEVLRSEGLVLA